MHIALFHNLPSGGAKRTLFEQTRRLVVNHDVDVYTLTSANHDFADLRSVISNYFVYNFQPLPLFQSPFGRLNQIIRAVDLIRLRRLSRYIAQEIDSKSYDVILVHPCRFENSPSVLSYLDETPSVYYCQEPLRLIYEVSPQRPYADNINGKGQILNRIDPFPFIYRSILHRFDQNNIRKAKTVLVNSRFSKERIKQTYDVNAEVCYHGVDTQHFRPLSTSKRRGLLSVGSLTPLKGFDFIIETVAMMPSPQRPIIEIASNFQNKLEREYLESLAAKLNVPIRLLSNVSDERLVELYNQAFIVVYTPVREPFGLVPLESMACATPVVGVDEGGVAESIIHKRTGLLVERQPKEFANAIQYLLSNPDLCAEYGRNGRDHVLQNWTWEVALAQLEGYLSGDFTAQN
jgi:glycosyltransferase involved in cell wall biosynthesis